MLSHNIEEILGHIHKASSSPAARRRGGADEVTLIAVSKTQPAEAIRRAYDCGLRNFGENRVQELLDKYDSLPKDILEDISWHMIGHLQRNKVKAIIGKVSLIHSVDSLRLAEEISREAVKKNLVMPILIEVNIAGEDSKYGIRPEECEHLIRRLSPLPGIRVQGLMTVAPFVEEEEENRKYFRALKQLSVDIGQKNIDNVVMDVLSMGMSGDYRTAIEEGATMVRIGTAVFGVRS